MASVCHRLQLDLSFIISTVMAIFPDLKVNPLFWLNIHQIICFVFVLVIKSLGIFAISRTVKLLCFCILSEKNVGQIQCNE